MHKQEEMTSSIEALSDGEFYIAIILQALIEIFEEAIWKKRLRTVLTSHIQATKSRRKRSS